MSQLSEKQKKCFVVGFFGSGKSEFCVNFAINKKYQYLCDLDVVNPYFRSRQVESVLNENNIKVVSSIEKDSRYLDIPLLSEEIFDLWKSDASVIYDLGGSGSGAVLIKQFDTASRKDYECLFTINTKRYGTNSVSNILKEIKKIEEAGDCKITGLVNNTNLLTETTKQDVLDGQEMIRQASKESGIPILYSCYSKNLSFNKDELDGEHIVFNMYLKEHK